jgi:hypothetical protein
MTTTDTLALLEAVLGYAGLTVHGATFATSERLKPFVDLGVLIPDGHVSDVPCHECNGDHMASIVLTEAGLRGVCLRMGLEFTPEIESTAYRVRAERLVDRLAASLDKPRRWAQPQGEPFLWSIGTFEQIGRRIGVYFMLQATDLGRFNDAIKWLQDEPRNDAVAVLTNESRDLGRLLVPWDGRVVRLSDYVYTDDRHFLTLDRMRLAERVLPGELLRMSKRGRPKSAFALASEIIPELDREGEMKKLGSARARYRVVLAAAKVRFGEGTTVSRVPCEEAWQAYVRTKRSQE